MAFGLENYQVEREEIPGLVAQALERVDMADFGQRMVHTLSGGQKQRAALAGVLALDPDILIFDEATAMLDPEGRREVLAQIRGLHERGRTVLMITHYVEEAALADRVVLMCKGCILADGTPREVLAQEELLKQTGLIPPEPVRVWLDLARRGVLPDAGALSGAPGEETGGARTGAPANEAGSENAWTAGPALPCPLTEEELAEMLWQLRRNM